MESLASNLPGLRARITSVVPTRGPSDFPVLATVDADGAPAVRSVVLRAYDPTGDTLEITTRADSAKVGQLRLNAQGELLLWIPEDRLQLRLRGTWSVLDTRGDARRDAGWSALSEATRRTFYWPDLQPPDMQSPPATFAILIGTIERIDALELTKPIHQRWVHEKTRSGWESREIPA